MEALIRQAIVSGFLLKEIDNYGLIRLSSKGESFLKEPKSFLMTEDHKYETIDTKEFKSNKANVIFDKRLMQILIRLRKQVAKVNEVPPYAVFLENSLEEMCLKYPITNKELSNINGVGEGKAKRYGQKFVDTIKLYVNENNITRPDDLVVKSTGVNSGLKLYLIQNIDRKLPFEDIANGKGMEIKDLIEEMETIVFSGTKLNINYYLEEIFDEDQLNELYEYFIESDSNSIKLAEEEFKGEYDEEELRLYRLKFMSEIAN